MPLTESRPNVKSNKHYADRKELCRQGLQLEPLAGDKNNQLIKFSFIGASLREALLLHHQLVVKDKSRAPFESVLHFAQLHETLQIYFCMPSWSKK